jgi:hypothetical protein
VLTTLEPRHTFTIAVGLSDPPRSGVISAGFEAEDWVGNRLARGTTFTLDGDAPPTIGMDQPGDGQQASTVNSLTVSGPASDPGCGLDRIEIGVRQRGGSGPYRVVKTIPVRSTGLPTPSFTYREVLPSGTLTPGEWELRALATSTTGRSAAVSRHIRVTAGPGLAPAPPAGRQPLSLPGIPSHPPIPPPR